MKLSPLFNLREEATPQLIELLNSVTLGTNGARYRHLHSDERIHAADHPLHLSIERNDKMLGNISFCRRESVWYIRYFAFDPAIQGGGKVKSRGGEGLLKRELEQFFSQLESGDADYGKVDAFYAYIDPTNEKSLWMSENFRFSTVANIATQTFSRVNPKATRVVNDITWEEAAPVFREHYGKFHFYLEHHLKKGPFYGIRDENGELVALTMVANAAWVIERLPGKLGGWLTGIIPYVPRLRKLIKPKHHAFCVPEAVCVRNNDPQLLETLFEGVLHYEKQNLILWWVDEKAGVYAKLREKVRWGTLHKLIGVHTASVVIRKAPETDFDPEIPVYTCGFDFI